MFANRLVILIENHAEKLSEGLTRKLTHSGECRELLRSVAPSELHHRTVEIYRHLGEWLLDKTESEIEERFWGMGARRAHQQIPFSEMIFAIHATKEHLWDYLIQEGLLEPEDLIGEMELLHVLERFFDRAVFFSAKGYEHAMMAAHHA